MPTDPPTDEFPVPSIEAGTQEFSAYVKTVLIGKLEEAKAEIGEKAWDENVSVIYGCSYGNAEQGVNLSIDGNLAILPPLMGIAIRSLAEQLKHHHEYVFCQGKEYRIAARIAKQVIDYAKHSHSVQDESSQ